MRRRIFTFHLLLFLLILFLPSCSSSSIDNEDFPEVNLPSNMMNTTIQIEDLPEFGNSYANNDVLLLHIKNISDKTIVFDGSSCILIYTKSADNWVSVANNMHSPSEILTLLPMEIFPPGMVVGTVPMIPDLVKDQAIRIVVLGHYENSEDQLVGAFLDVTISP
jgi:hypothetical protein